MRLRRWPVTLIVTLTLLSILLLAAAATAQPPTYYVAITVPGASNTACDGLAPTAESATRCPFRDFAPGSPAVALLKGTRGGFRMEVRGGTYPIAPLGLAGLEVRGVGSSGDEVTHLTNYRDEVPIFDGGLNVQQVISQVGTYTRLDRVTVQRGGGYNLLVRGAHHLVQDNVFGPNGSSDSVKGTGGATQVVVRRNTFHGWMSQALDINEVTHWHIYENTFRDPGPGVAGHIVRAIGLKVGTCHVLIERNRFEGVGIALGGISSPHPWPFEACDITVRYNALTNVTGKEAIKLYSCRDCQILHNTISMVGPITLAIVLGGPVYEQSTSGCLGGAGCPATIGATILGNRIQGAAYFLATWPSETIGITSDQNAYHGGGQFYAHPVTKTFTQWQSMLGTAVLLDLRSRHLP